MKVIKIITNRERLLISQAKFLLKNNNNILLGGSLMLTIRGINKRREAQDIDVIIINSDSSLLNTLDDNGYKNIKNGSVYEEGSLVRTFYNEKLNIKIDLLYVEKYVSSISVIDDIQCASIDSLIKAKYEYLSKNKKAISIEKHKLDLSYLFENNRL